MPIKRILLSGGSGMVGRNIREYSEAKNYILSAPSHTELDLKDENAISEFISEFKPDIVIHSAGTVGGIQANITRPVDFLVDNIKVGMNLILASRKNQIKRFLNIGSSCMYPRAAENPLKEEVILKGELEPTNEGYAIAKITCARLCEYINREDPEFLYKTIIPCNLYGKYDKFDPKNSHMIPAVIRKTSEAVQNNSNKIEIWGDGKARREFMYAEDLADFIFYSFKKFEELPNYLNVGLGYDYSINEYYEAVAKVIGFNGEFFHDISKPTGMAQKLVDTSLLKKFGWSSKTTLSEGINKTYKFYLKEVSK